MTDAAQPTGTLDAALAQGGRMLGRRPDLAEQQARAILEAAPGHPAALLLLAQAVGRQGDLTGALSVLEPLAQGQPRWGAAHLELGLARGAAGDGRGAVRALEQATSLKPDLAEAWGALADQRRLLGDPKGADAARARRGTRSCWRPGSPWSRASSPWPNTCCATC